MSHFQRKHLTHQDRVCVRLKAARKAAGLSLSDMAEKTRLNKLYIRALEQCEYDKLPHGTIYQKNFIKKYLEALDISPTPFIQQFLLEEHAEEPSHTNTSSQSIARTSRISLHALPSLLKYVGATAVFLGVLGYLGWQVHGILKPPTLTLISPVDGHITTEERVTIRGISDPETHISINGKDVTYTEAGAFEQTLDLVEGVNTIVVSATKKHGKTSTETRYITHRRVQHISVEAAEEQQS